MVLLGYKGINIKRLISISLGLLLISYAAPSQAWNMPAFLNTSTTRIQEAVVRPLIKSGKISAGALLGCLSVGSACLVLSNLYKYTSHYATILATSYKKKYPNHNKAPNLFKNRAKEEKPDFKIMAIQTALAAGTSAATAYGAYKLLVK